MSTWGMNANASKSCCKGCTERREGCHDVNVCMAWAAEVARRKVIKERREAQKPVLRKSWEARKLVEGR